MRKALSKYFEQQAKPWLWLEVIVLIFICGLIDYVTGWELSLTVFYAVPILLMVRFGNQPSAILVAIICAVIWWWADVSSGHPYLENWHQTWEAMTRLAFFLMVVFGGSAVRSRIELLEQSQRLEREIIRISEREQQRIGRDLHDGICQFYAAIGCAAGSLKNHLGRRGAAETEAAAEIEELIMKGVAETRSLARGLFPVEDDEGGLRSALEELAGTARRLLNVDCVAECDTAIAIRNNAFAAHLFRIAQEALNNATSHGKARTVRIRLGGDGNEITLSIIDTGVGMQNPPPNQGGLGLGIMQYRARMMGGRLSISPNPGGGVIVACSISKIGATNRYLNDESIR